MFRAARSIAAGMVTIAFPYLILQTLGYPAVTLGLVYTAAAVTTAASSLVFGFLADSWGRKQALIAAGALLPAGCLLLYLSGTTAAVYASAMLGGFSATGSLMGGGVGGAAQPIQSAFIADLTTQDKRTTYFSVFTFASGMFAALGALLSRVLEPRELFLCAAIISGAGVAFLIPTRGRAQEGRARGLTSRAVIGKFTITGVLNGFSQGLVTPFLVPFFILVYDVPKSRMSTYSFVSGAIGALALLAAPVLERHWGFVRSIAMTRGLGALLLAIMPHSPLPAVALGIYFVFPALRVAAVPAQQTAVTVLVESGEVGRALGINQIARLAASSGATTLTGYLFHTDNIALPFYLYAGITLLNVLLYIRFFGISSDLGHGPIEN